MSDDRFRVTSTMRDLNQKLKIKIEDDKAEKIYWYIKFNLVLDKASVTNKTMHVMDTEGYIMRTYIAYDTYRNLIVVSPMDTYVENKYYILSISTEVRSEKGQNLRRAIHIMFMLINNRISRYEILRATAKLPDPRPRPENYDHVVKGLQIAAATVAATAAAAAVATPPPGPTQREADPPPPVDPPKPTLPMQSLNLKLGMVIASLPILGIGFFTNFVPMFFLGVLMFVLGLFIMVRELIKIKSKIYYNLGAYRFNKEKYGKSMQLLEKSYNIDRNNYARNALRKVRHYV
ncbi:MAG: hypothetical protein FWG63_09850 [Defluviitaleaceae bacterium]|nr:hypothetical protein [Defluviitaleaceae bacterium]